ncbi:hypothetical protein GCM10010464_49290 [Pseudonocardia yunnanensis]
MARARPGHEAAPLSARGHPIRSVGGEERGRAHHRQQPALYGDRDRRHRYLAAQPAGLAGFKLGIVLEGTYARACAGQADPAVGARLHRSAVELLTRAAEIAGT